MAKNESKEKRYIDIIGSAVNEFLEKGYEGCSMNSIAARAGLSKGGLYHHFSSKQEILIAANQVYMHPIYRMMHDAKKVEFASDALVGYIRSYLKHWEMHIKELEFTFLSLSKVLANEALWGEIEDYSKQMTSFFKSLFIKGTVQSVFKKHDPLSRAILLFSSLDGITGYMVMSSNFSSERASKHFEKVFIEEILLTK